MFLPDVILTLKYVGKLCPRKKNPNPKLLPSTVVQTLHPNAQSTEERTVDECVFESELFFWKRWCWERERRGVRTGKGAATVWVEASADVTWRAGCSLSSTQLQCHLKVDPPQLQHFLSGGLWEEHLLVSRFYIPTGDFFLTSTISLSLSVTLPLSQYQHKRFLAACFTHFTITFQRRLVNAVSTIKSLEVSFKKGFKNPNIFLV